MLWDAGPVFVIALVLASGVVVLTQRGGWVRSALHRVSGSLLAAIMAGAILPGCALSTLPMALVLRRNGARVGTLTAFMVTSPVIGPVSIILTAALLDWRLAFLRVALPIAAVMALGATLNMAGRSRAFGMPAIRELEDAAERGDGACCRQAGDGGKGLSFWRTLGGMTRSLVPMLLIGLLSAALLRQWIPATFIEAWLRESTVAYVMAALAGVPAYVCEGGEVPLTLALLELGVGIGPAFTFMLAAVGTCVPTILVAPRIIGMTATCVYAAFWLFFATAAGAFVGIAL